MQKDVLYLNRDFPSLRQSLIDFAKNYFPNTYNDFNEADPGMMFMEMSSYVGDVLSYYTDKQLKESLLLYASEAGNVNALANASGYKTKNRIPSIVELEVYQLLPAKASGSVTVPDWSYALTIKEGMYVQAESNKTEFRTTEVINFKASSSFSPTEVTVYQIDEQTGLPEYYLIKKKAKAVAGNLKTTTFTFTSPKRFDQVTVTDTNIIGIESVTDSSNNVWYEVPWLAQDTVFDSVYNNELTNTRYYQYNDTVPYILKLKKVPRRFVTRFNSSNDLILQFGSGVSDSADEEIVPNVDNLGLGTLQMGTDFAIDPSNFMFTKTYGLVPANTTLTVRYTVGGGLDSNVPAYDIKTVLTVEFEDFTDAVDTTLGNFIRQSLACTNPNRATGGKNLETVDEVRQNAIANVASQLRAVTGPDYLVRCYAMPVKYGSVAKAYLLQDTQIDVTTNTRVNNPLALNIYCLAYDGNNNLIPLNAAIKENLRTYLSQYRLMTDAINLMDAYVINIGVEFDIVSSPGFNNSEVILKCIETIKRHFDINKWQINQPIVISKLYTELDKVEGVQTVVDVKIKNLFNVDAGYSGNVYDIRTATRNGVIYPSLDPSIFEIKYPNTDIIGRTVSM